MFPLAVALSHAWVPALQPIVSHSRTRAPPLANADPHVGGVSNAMTFQSVDLASPPLTSPSPNSFPLSVDVPAMPIPTMPMPVDVPIAAAPPFVLPPLASPPPPTQEGTPDEWGRDHGIEVLSEPSFELDPPAFSDAGDDEQANGVVGPCMKDLALFAIPTLAIWLSSPLLSLIDTSVVGTVCSTAELAALGPSTKTCDNIAYFASAIGAATTNLAADAFAGRRPAQAHRIVGGSLTIALVLGVLITGGLRVAALPLMTNMIGAGSAASIGPAAQYTAIRAFGYPAALTTMVLQAAFLASKDATSPLLALPAVALINLIGDFVLVGPMGMGPAGAAWATIASQFVNAAMLLALWKRKLATGRPEGCGSAAEGCGAGVPLLSLPTRQEFRSLLVFIAPMMLAIGARSYMGIAIAATVATLGTASLASHQIVECLYWLFTPFGDAISLSVQAFLPALLKHGQSAARGLQRLALRGAGVLGLLVAVSGFALLAFAPGLFSSCANVGSICGDVAPLLGASLFGYAISGALEGALLARRQLRLLAASHVLNTAILAFALRRLAAGMAGMSSSGGLRQIWGLVACLNVARIVEFVFGLRRAQDDAARAAVAPLEMPDAQRRGWRRLLRRSRAS